MADDSNNAAQRLERLLGYLQQDATNLELLADAAECALGCHRGELARELLERYAALAPLGEREINLSGLASLALNDYEAAAQSFATLLETHPRDANLRFNRAWALAMVKRFEEALALLDDETSASLAQAATLQVQLMHELGMFDEGFERAKRYADLFPNHSGLMAAASVLAIDMEDVAFAKACAEKAGAHPDALTTLGVLALAEGRDQDAGAQFETALARNSQIPRAWIGKGLVAMTGGSFPDAAKHLRHGAEMFDSHIGSWIATGWAYLLAGDVDSARECFDKALSLDHNFAESHGSLAVIAIMQGNTDEAQRLSDTALRLDRQSFSAALAKSLLLEAQGKTEIAQRIIERAMNTPIDASGLTIARAVAMRALLA